MAAAIKAEVDGALEEATNARKLAVVCDLNVEADTDFPRPTADVLESLVSTAFFKLVLAVVRVIRRLRGEGCGGVSSTCKINHGCNRVGIWSTDYGWLHP